MIITVVSCLHFNETACLENVINYTITNIYSYLETSGGQSPNINLNVVHFLNTSVNQANVATEDSCFPAQVFNTLIFCKQFAKIGQRICSRQDYYVCYLIRKRRDLSALRCHLPDWPMALFTNAHSSLFCHSNCPREKSSVAFTVGCIFIKLLKNYFL